LFWIRSVHLPEAVVLEVLFSASVERETSPLIEKFEALTAQAKGKCP
jgi:hypothetical protein